MEKISAQSYSLFKKILLKSYKDLIKIKSAYTIDVDNFF